MGRSIEKYRVQGGSWNVHLDLVIAIINLTLTPEGTVVTFGYAIIFIIGSIAAETRDVLITLVLCRCVEESYGFTTQNSGPNRLRRIHNMCLVALILVAVLAIYLHINYTAEIISTGYDPTDDLFFASTQWLASSVAYYEIYLAITIQALMLTLLYGFESPQSKRPAAFLLITGFALWVYALAFLGLKGSSLAGSDTELMDDIVPCVAYITGAVSFIGLAVNGRLRTGNVTKGGLNEQEIGTGYAYGRDGPTELPYQPDAGIHEAPSGKAHEAPANTKGARAEMWGDSAQIYEASDNRRSGNMGLLKQWRGKQQSTPIVEAPA